MTENNTSNWLGGMGVAGVLFIILIGAILWATFYKERRSDERALTAELCNTRTTLGQHGSAITANREFLGYTVPRLDNLSYDYAYTRGKFQSGIKRNTADISNLDNAVFVSGCNSGSSCSRKGRGEFTERTKYVQDGVAEIIRRESCGSEFNA